jgi:hypothetical protein
MGADLDNFINRFRPDFQFAKTTSEYEMLEYIQTSFKQFKSEMALKNC